MAEIVDTLMSLVRIPSQSGHERAISLWIEGWLQERSIPASVIDNNVVVHLRSKATNKTCLILNGHMDTVSASAPHLWKYPPHGPEAGVVREGKIFGLGASDMKASLATYLHLLESVQQRALPFDLVACFVTEEETSGAGTQRFLEHFNRELRQLYTKVGCIIGEPTGSSFIEVGCRGSSFIELLIQGASRHGARVKSVEETVVGVGLEAVRRIEMAATTWENDFADEILGAPSATVTAFQTADSSANQTPSECRLRWDVRSTPQFDDQVLSAFQATIGDLGKVSFLHPPCASSFVPADSPIVRVIKGAAGPIDVRAAVGGNDGTFFTACGIDAVCFGPGEKSVIHQPNEFALIDKVVDSLALHSSILDSFATLTT